MDTSDRWLPLDAPVVLGTGSFGGMERTTPFMEHSVFNTYDSETEMLRYLHELESKDLSATC